MNLEQQQLQAVVKVGANKGRVVTISEYAEDSGKWIIDWPNSAAIGYFKHNELLPIGNWHFGDEKTIVHTAKAAKQFPNGDPFSLIPLDYAYSTTPVLIDLDSGVVTTAYPYKGYYDPSDNEIYYSHTMTERLYVIADSLFEHDSVKSTSNFRFVDEKHVIAWRLLPSSLDKMPEQSS